MMKLCVSTLVRALLIVIAASAVGMGLNTVSGRALPWIYVPPKQVMLSGVTVPLINEKEARRFLVDTDTVFVDTRLEKDFAKSHIKGAVFLQPSDKEERFPEVQPLLPEYARLVLYCYGPECPMAEEVASFLAQLGYNNMMIMTAGFRGWEKAGYPIALGPRSGQGTDQKAGSKSPGD
jgi:rhodanese-related sulfurtransferase